MKASVKRFWPLAIIAAIACGALYGEYRVWDAQEQRKSAQPANAVPKADAVAPAPAKTPEQTPAVAPPPAELSAATANPQATDAISAYWVVLGHKVKITDSLLALFTLCLVGVGVVQAKRLKETVAATARSVDILAQSERAVLFVVTGDDNVQDTLEISRDTPASAQRFAVSYHFQNYGKTPAIRAEFGANIVMTAELPETPHYLPVMNVLRERALGAGTSTVPFQCRSEESYALDGSLAESIIDQTGPSIWFFGHATYMDIFGNQHRHRFLYRWDRARRRFAPADDERYCEDV